MDISPILVTSYSLLGHHIHLSSFTVVVYSTLFTLFSSGQKKQVLLCVADSPFKLTGRLALREVVQEIQIPFYVIDLKAASPSTFVPSVSANHH